MRRDRELEAGTSAHYDDPAYYTKAYGDRLADVDYYVELARTRRGPVLEYGCGNGRITLALAQAGVEVVGLDLSSAMLRDLRRRLGALSPEIARRVTLRRVDMRSVRFVRRFALVICPFNAFLHLYDRRSVERFLGRAREHLAAHAELVLDVSMPDPCELARTPERALFAPRFRYPVPASIPKSEPGPMVRYSERFDYDRFRQILFVGMDFEPLDGSPSWMTPLAHRQFFPQELEALLYYNGFRVTERYGDFDKSPLRSESPTILLHCRAQRRRGAERESGRTRCGGFTRSR
jgi:SAM-dependent methyltransferase